MYVGKPTANWVPGPSVVLRIIQAFCEKSAKFAQYADRGIVAADDACVIAINIRRIPYADMDVERWFKSALYAVGNEFYWYDHAGTTSWPEGFSRFENHIVKVYRGKTVCEVKFHFIQHGNKIRWGAGLL